MRRGYRCDPHNAQCGLRHHEHEFVGKTSLLILIIVTFSVGLQDISTVGQDRQQSLSLNFEVRVMK